MKRGFAFAAAGGMLVLTFGVTYSTPDDTQIQAPFVSSATVGHQVYSQHLTAEVHAVSLAHVVEIDDWTGTTSGIWLVVDASVAATTQTELIEVEVRIGDSIYPASTRPGLGSLTGRAVDAGFSLTGPIVIELPADILDRPGATNAIVEIASGLDARLDNQIELRLDLTKLDVSDRVTLDRTSDDWT